MRLLHRLQYVLTLWGDKPCERERPQQPRIMTVLALSAHLLTLVNINP